MSTRIKNNSLQPGSVTSLLCHLNKLIVYNAFLCFDHHSYLQMEEEIMEIYFHTETLRPKPLCRK